MLWRNIRHCCSCSLLLHLFFLSSPPLQSLLSTTTNETYTFIKCFFLTCQYCVEVLMYIYIYLPPYENTIFLYYGKWNDCLFLSFFTKWDIPIFISPPILVFVLLSLLLSSVWCISSSILWSNIYLLHVGCLVFPLCLWWGGAGCRDYRCLWFILLCVPSLWTHTKANLNPPTPFPLWVSALSLLDS